MTRKEINQNKIQEYAVYLSTKFKHIVLQWATGCGKSLAAIRVIDNDIKVSTNEKGEWNRWYIVVAERQHIRNWEDDIHKHGFGYLLELGYVEIFCYQSLHKFKDRTANLILDEAHSVTDLRLDCLATIKFDKMVSLSATLETERERQLASLSRFHKYVIDTDKAIKAGILPPPTIVKVEFQLSPALGIKYAELTTSINVLQEIINTNAARVNEIIRIFPESPKIKELKDQIIEDESKLLKLRVSRKALVCNAKTTTAQWIQKSFETDNKRYIIFTGTSSQTDRLGNSSSYRGAGTPGSNAIHSTVGGKENDKRIREFNEGKINGLVCQKMLRQGTNLNNIHVGMIVQLDSTQLSFIQMMGRVFRSTAPVLYVFVAKDTIDEVYWDQCSKGLDPSYITTYKEYKKLQPWVGTEEKK